MFCSIPCCSQREMLKEADEEWVKEGRPPELNTLSNTSFSLPICCQGKQHKTLQHVRIRFFTADHHHLWWECGGRCCVTRPWHRHKGVRDLFCHLPHSL